MRYFFLLISLCLLGSPSFAQEQAQRGQITFVTSKNVYTSFALTDAIEIGDTLLIQANGTWTPCLLVERKSSSSCVSKVIDGCKIEKGDTVLHFGLPKVEGETASQTSAAAQVPAEKKERIRGRLSAASYSTLTNTRDDNHRLMYRFNLNMDHIRESGFSLETYVTYRQLLVNQEAASRLNTDFLNVFNLALKYQTESQWSFVLGRKINDKAASLGAIDGFQAEKNFDRLYVGAIAGFRPNLVDHSLNTNLQQYGAYAGWRQRGEKFSSESTLGFLQQMNAGGVDRQYLYFQHNSSIGRKISVFSSAELDLFDGQSGSGARLTNLYASARYRLNSKWSFMLSYDSRRRIVYYETFRTQVESLLANDEAMQGLRVRVNYRPAKRIGLGLAYSTRFQASNINPSDNLNGFASFTRIPTIGGRAYLGFNRNRSYYLTSTAMSVRYTRDIIRNKLDFDVYFRYLNYDYTPTEAIINSTASSSSYFYGAGLNYNLTRTLSLAALGELSTRQADDVYRINFRIIQRFDSKKRKSRNRRTNDL